MNKYNHQSMISEKIKQTIFNSLVKIRRGESADDLGLVGTMTRKQFNAANQELRKNGMPPFSNKNIYINRKALEHVNESRTDKDGMTVKQITNVIQRALSKRAVIVAGGANEANRVMFCYDENKAIIVRADEDGVPYLVTVYGK